MQNSTVHPYIPNTVPSVIEEMLAVTGASSIEEFYEDIPQSLRVKGLLNLPEPFLAEAELEEHVTGLLNKNRSTREVISFLGAGVYNHYVPSVVDEVINRSEFLTAYAGEPYEDHGRFQALFEYTSMMGEMLNMDVVNVPTYDGMQATATALAMAGRITGRSKIIVASDVNPDLLSKVTDYVRSHTELVFVPTVNGLVDTAALAAAGRRRHLGRLDRDPKLPRRAGNLRPGHRRPGARVRCAAGRGHRPDRLRQPHSPGRLGSGHRLRRHPVPGHPPVVRRRTRRLHRRARRPEVRHGDAVAPLRPGQHLRRGRVRLRRRRLGPHLLRPARRRQGMGRHRRSALGHCRRRLPGLDGPERHGRPGQHRPGTHRLRPAAARRHRRRSTGRLGRTLPRIRSRPLGLRQDRRRGCHAPCAHATSSRAWPSANTACWSASPNASPRHDIDTLVISPHRFPDRRSNTWPFQSAPSQPTAASTRPAGTSRSSSSSAPRASAASWCRRPNRPPSRPLDGIEKQLSSLRRSSARRASRAGPDARAAPLPAPQPGEPGRRLQRRHRPGHLHHEVQRPRSTRRLIRTPKLSDTAPAAGRGLRCRACWRSSGAPSRLIAEISGMHSREPADPAAAPPRSGPTSP